MKEEILSFYAEHSPMTTPGEHAKLFHELPEDIPTLCIAIQGLMVHVESVELHGGDPSLILQLPQFRVKDMLDEILTLNDSPLNFCRDIDERIRVVCRDFALLLCSILREKGIPARTRCGYTRYLTDAERDTSEFVYDHWLCEYWNGERWVLVDPELDELELKAYTSIPVNPHDIDRDKFINSGEAWLEVKEGRHSPEYFGDPESPFHGMRLLKMQLMLDLASLNKMELLANDEWYNRNEHPDDIAMAIDKDNLHTIRELFKVSISFSYHDTHRHRLGANYELLPINAPKSGANNYQRDGPMRSDDGGSGPNYWPNSFQGPDPDPEYALPEIDIHGMAARHEYELGDIDFVQPAALFNKVMNDRDREHLIGNIVAHLGGAHEKLQLRQTALFYKVDPEYGGGVAEGLGLPMDEVKKLAEMSQEERVKATAL